MERDSAKVIWTTRSPIEGSAARDRTPDRQGAGAIADMFFFKKNRVSGNSSSENRRQLPFAAAHCGSSCDLKFPGMKETGANTRGGVKMG